MKKKEVQDEIAQLTKKLNTLRDAVGGPGKPKGRDFMKIYQDSARLFADMKGVFSQTDRVLWFFISECNYDNEVYTTQQEMALRLGIPLNRVNLAITKLRQAKIITKGPRAKHKTCYRINYQDIKKGYEGESSSKLHLVHPAPDLC